MARSWVVGRPNDGATPVEPGSGSAVTVGRGAANFVTLGCDERARGRQPRPHAWTTPNARYRRRDPAAPIRRLRRRSIYEPSDDSRGPPLRLAPRYARRPHPHRWGGRLAGCGGGRRIECV